MRTLASAMRAAEMSGRRLIMTWRIDSEMGARFEDLFETQLDTDRTALDGLSKVEFNNPTFIDPAILRNQDVEVVEITAHTAFGFDSDARAYGVDFWRRLRPYLLALQPVYEIKQPLQRVADRLGGSGIGVHIRSGSESVGFEKASYIRLAQFVEAIRQEAQGRDPCSLYVASDAVAPILALRQAFPGQVTTLESVFEQVPIRHQGDSASVQMALVDLLCLARCEKIIGSYYSSFSEIASVLGDRPLRRIGGPASLAEHWRELVIALKPNNVRQQGIRLVFEQLLRHLSGLWRILSKPVRKRQ